MTTNTNYLDPKQRILKDIRKIFKSNLATKENPIYTWFDQENIFHSKTMMIGPEDTPYHNGYYLFDIIFPKDYPLNPPSFKYLTLDSAWRANPNLYKDGKVCVSLLNTCSMYRSKNVSFNSEGILYEPG